MSTPAELPGAPNASPPRPAIESRRQQRRSHLLIAALCAALGFAIVIQVRRSDTADALATARPQDLVAVLDGLNRRADELSAEVTDLQRVLDQLQRGGASSQAALAEAQLRAQTLAILAGTAPATGPGVTLQITDPQTRVTPEVLLAALQELRNAGAEAVQFAGVRVGVESAFGGSAGAITLDGTALTAPYQIIAIGDPPTLTAALSIPGGVSDTAQRAGGELTISHSGQVTVDAIREPRAYTYARPAT